MEELMDGWMNKGMKQCIDGLSDKELHRQVAR